MQRPARHDLSKEKLIEEATKAVGGEICKTLTRSPLVRIGLVVAIEPEELPSFSLELVLRVLPSFSQVGPGPLAKAQEVVSSLMEYGYSITHEDDGCLVCRKQIEYERMRQEHDHLLRILS